MKRVFYVVLALHMSALAFPPALIARKHVTRGVPHAVDSLPGGKIIDTVVCRSAPAQSYALYIPRKAHKGAWPVIYFFDPHADGALPLRKYKSLADTYGFILAGSNHSKNGNDWTTTENIWRNLSADTKDRLKIDPERIYTCGFSGGAKAAGYIAIQHPVVKGVIAGGAGLPDGVPAGDFNFSFTAIAGEGDMNLTELVAISRDLDNTRTRHRLILFDGKHQWSPESTMSLAFAGLQFDAMQKGLIPKDESFINLYIGNSRRRFDVFYKASQLIKARQECSLSISLLQGLTKETSWFSDKAAALDKNTAYLRQRKTQEDLWATEQNRKAEYQEHFQQDDSRYWTTTINGLKAEANAKNSGSGMHQRLLAYLSLAFYSISNHLINDNRNKEAGHFVELYKMADPTNSEAWYFSAILDARRGDTRAAENDLQKAVRCGFTDRRRMLQQPEFQNLSPKMHFPGIAEKIYL